MEFAYLFGSEAKGTSLHIFFFLIFVLADLSSAADINLSLHQQSVNDTVTITLQNDSAQSVDVKLVYIDIDGQRYDYPSGKTILPHKNGVFRFKIGFPQMKGSYPLTVTVRYLNDGKLLTLRHVGLFYFQQPVPINASCSIENTSITGEGEVIVKSGNPEIWKLILPEELHVISSESLPGKKIFRIRSDISGFKNKYPVFAIAEGESEGVHRTGICSGTLTINTTRQITFQRGRMPPGILLPISSLFLIITFYAIKRNYESDIMAALGKYAGRMFFISMSYYVLKNADSWINAFLTYIDFKPCTYLAGFAVDSLRGGNYQNFFHYFIDAYFIGCLLLIFPYLYFLDADKPILSDKYVSFARTVLSLPAVFLRRKPYWNTHSRLGMLTILVKIFFAPIMVSWAMNNIFHIKNLIFSHQQWNVYAINSFLVDIFILIDTSIFSVGYLLESRHLKNEIKSVDPTFLGWLVCLWCYPPFNSFSFKLFDYQLMDIAIKSYPQWVHILLTCVITFLWGIFVWASMALGFKASNLTNRGIISSGPYSFVRHPAYAAKVLIWIIQGVFFAQFTSGILIAFAVIYILRAWTEERHLSLDADYIAYKNKVKWWFIPGVI